MTDMVLEKDRVDWKVGSAEQVGSVGRIKRASDSSEHNHEHGSTCINIHVLEERLKALQERLLCVEQAFPRTSVGTPAFDKHRDYHEEEQLKETRVKQIQHEITKKIIVIVFGALLSTLLSGYADDIFKVLKQIPLYSRELKHKEIKQGEVVEQQ